MQKTIYACILAALLGISTNSHAQTRSNSKKGAYKFTIEKEIGATEVKNQFKSSTCWSFSTESFLESEVMRMGKGAIDLSEMYIIHNAYSMKADRYVRMQGKTNFGPGGEPHDVMNIIREKGIVPQEVYAGLYQGMNKPMHNEMDNVLKVMLDEVNKLADGGKTSPRWKEAFNGALDGYMGKMPETFTYKGQTYTPISFMKSLGINPDDYVEISSFTHHPFYEQFALEVPDNWAWGKVYNVPLAEMEQIVDNAVNNNYSVAWASDVSEKGFSFKDGLAIVPNKDWDQMSKEERDSTFIKPIAEKEITQDIRQQAFDNQSTQDDHGMHIIGIAKDQGGKKFYLVKNSWGTEGNDLQGYFYCSAPYFQYKTTCVMVHKKAIPAAIAQKLKIKQ